MQKKRQDTVRSDRSPKADDLKLIHGIGPTVEKRLNDVGIFTFLQLASLSPADIGAAVTGVKGLTAERILTEKWVEQALRLVEQQQEELPSPVGNDATFTVKFQLNSEREVLSIHALHVESGNEEIWSKWSDAQFSNFFAQQAQIRLPELATPALHEESNESEVLAPVEVVEEAVLTPIRKLRVHGPEVVTRSKSARSVVLAFQHAFAAQLVFDLTDFSELFGNQLDYNVHMYAKSMEEHTRIEAGEAQGSVLATERLALVVEGKALPRGMYRLEADVTITSQEATASQDIATQARTKGSLFLIA